MSVETPIVDFLRRYHAAEIIRFHMPGHKGRGALGCEGWDITEVAGADALYEAEGIIATSERTAAALFGARRTCFSTEGSSQCIRAMLYLALMRQKSRVVVAARNVHRAFIHAAALLDLEIVWLLPEQRDSLCRCTVTAATLEQTLRTLPQPPAAVYLTSPDYLGGMAALDELAAVAHRYGTILAVDNAHGAYLRFLPQSLHPLDHGADLCCDSAHKTLPVLTGGAYLHLSQRLDEETAAQAKSALALFGSTSPSYLTLASLDACNQTLSQNYRESLRQTIALLDQTRQSLRERGWHCDDTDPLRLTLRATTQQTGRELAQLLRCHGIECEYADRDHLVLMVTANNTPQELSQLVQALGVNTAGTAPLPALPQTRIERVLSVREAFFCPHETLPPERSLGRICAAPTVACPPAIPIVVSGERIDETALQLFAQYGVQTVEVVR